MICLDTVPPAACALSVPSQGVDVDPEHVTVLTGAGSVIDLMLHCIADPGDAVLIPAPYYPAFDNDLKVSGRAVLPEQLLTAVAAAAPA